MLGIRFGRAYTPGAVIVFAVAFLTTLVFVAPSRGQGGGDTCRKDMVSGRHYHSGEQNGAGTPDVCRGGNHPSSVVEEFRLGGGSDDGHGRDGLDDLYGGDGFDLLHGGPGDDDLYGQHGQDTLRGGKGNDWMEGSNDPDKMHGDSFGDVMFGGHDCCQAAENDAMYGNSGQDDIADAYGSDHDLACGGTFDDDISVADGDESDAVYDRDFPTKEEGDLWMDQNACTVPEGGDAASAIADSLQVVLDDAPDDVLEIIFTILDLVPALT
jgi:Ca2+-binding RTX toxin-like protein